MKFISTVLLSLVMGLPAFAGTAVKIKFADATTPATRNDVSDLLAYELKVGNVADNDSYIGPNGACMKLKSEQVAWNIYTESTMRYNGSGIEVSMAEQCLEDSNTTVLKCATALSDPDALVASMEIKLHHIVDQTGYEFNQTELTLDYKGMGPVQHTHNIPYMVTKERLLKEIARATSNEDVIVMAADLMREAPLAPPAIGMVQVGLFYLRASKESGTTLTGTMDYFGKTGSLFCDPLK